MKNFFKNIFSDKPESVPSGTKTTVVIAPVVKRAWRVGMWVMTPDGIGIIFRLQEPVCVHLVNTKDGTTLREALYDSSKVRQAKYLEIPECRRMLEEKAKSLGYE